VREFRTQGNLHRVFASQKKGTEICEFLSLCVLKAASRSVSMVFKFAVRRMDTCEMAGGVGFKPSRNCPDTWLPIESNPIYVDEVFNTNVQIFFK